MDKRDIYWCLSSEGLYSMATSHSGMVFSQIENRLSKYIVGKLVKLAKKRRNRQTLWGGCTDANPKLLLNDT